MAAEPKPTTQPVWSSGGTIIEPSEAKKALGWVTEKPPSETWNWILHNLASFAAHVNESGIPEWDKDTSYDVDALAKGSDGTVYVSNNNNNRDNDPAGTDPTNAWDVAFVQATSGLFSQTRGLRTDSFRVTDLPHMKLLLDSSPGPFTLHGQSYTHDELKARYEILLNSWLDRINV